ncbi:hypothetical protein GCM10009122_23830 [Fulvivirga kasyanovii]|uniref:hypothetical protein n=1 Tax=Fulvivirga kasyanovii TaxID=396812 RepID=UPI0012BC6B5E|nr:hypothetical protein [Fulvivirga kasyanovii]
MKPLEDSWLNIGKVKGMDNSTTINEYSLPDKKPLQGYNYYRLKFVDADGGRLIAK